MTIPPPASTARTRQIVHQIASQCEVTPDQVEDAYPCTTFQTTCFKESTKDAGITHFNFVFKLNDSTSEAFDRLTKAFRSVYDRTPLLRTRIVRYTEHEATTPRVVQAVIDRTSNGSNSTTLSIIAAKGSATVFNMANSSFTMASRGTESTWSGRSITRYTRAGHLA
jgi:hypothetical protein